MTEDKHLLKIYSINNKQLKNPYDPKCYWWIPPKNYQMYDDHQLLLEVELCDNEHVLFDANKYFRENIAINYFAPIVKQEAKRDLYNYIINELKPKNVNFDIIGN